MGGTPADNQELHIVFGKWEIYCYTWSTFQKNKATLDENEDQTEKVRL